MSFDGADFQAPAVVKFVREGWGPDVSDRPRLRSLRGANLANLTIADVDLRDCRFAGAYGLDQMRIEETCRFPDAPPGFRWARRRVIAEEGDWRRIRQGHRSWGSQAPEDGVHPLEPSEIAAIYRALRKGREDAKDEPGAADFYYGEMEMRRHSRASPEAGVAARLKRFGEQLVLWFYWLASGYGTRPSRALLALLLTVVVFAALFQQWGFPPGEGRSMGGALRFSAQSTTSLFRPPTNQPLTATGEWLEMALRLLGPLFFGLTLLALRGRVKR